MSPTAAQQYAQLLYSRLPAIYRTRDAANGSPLQALISVLAAQGSILQDNIEQLYEDQFIETCASWVIPYIGDLVGANPVYEIGAAAQKRRAEVANTIGYRRRKGTLLALEQVSMDVSGMRASAVEFFQRLITNESMKHVRPDHAATFDVRDGDAVASLGSPFGTTSRTIDVRRIGPRVRAATQPDTTPLDIALHGGGKYNIPDIGIYLWRWKSRPVLNAPAFTVDDRRYMFSPLGQDMPLFNVLPPRDSFARLSTRMDVPQPIGRREFFENPAAFYGPGLSVQIVIDGTSVDVSRICVRNLSDTAGGQWNGCTRKGAVAIDPELGRIQLAGDLPIPKQLRVSYAYGFPADLGGGPYDRSANLPALTPSAFAFQAVAGSPATPTLESAVSAWNAVKPGAIGLIVLPGFESYSVNLTRKAAISVPSQSTLYIVSAQVEAAGVPGLSNACVTLRGTVEIQGVSPVNSDPANPPAPGQLILNGVWLSGSIHVAGAPSNIQLSDCTLVPGVALNRNLQPVAPGDASVVVDSPGSSVSLIRCITGPVAVGTGAEARICSSIVDASSPCAVAYAGSDLATEGSDLHIEGSTVIGKVWTHSMELASNTIFLARRGKGDPWQAAVWCSRRQSGCMRFCFVPSDSLTPKRFRCIPEDPVTENSLLPKFVSLQYGRPSYGLLSGDVPMAIWTGADDGSQMGVYHLTQETQAVANVQLRAPEFLPFNLEAGIFLEPSRAIVLPRPPAGYGSGRHVDRCGDVDDELLFVGIGAHLI